MISHVQPSPSLQPDHRDFLRERMRGRIDAGEAYFTGHAAAIAACAAAMADRFFEGATLLVMGSGPGATDAQHNSVEYVHPVLPGCRALPALSLTNDVALVSSGLDTAVSADVYSHQIRILGRDGDIALAFAKVPLPAAVANGLAQARARGMLTVALLTGEGGDDIADHCFGAGAADAMAGQELQLATYHMLWELVHIVLNHRGIAR